MMVRTLRMIVMMMSALVLIASAFTTQRLYFTVNTQAGGTGVEPGFQLNFIWTSLGVGKNGHIYAAVSDELRSGFTPIDSSAKGNVCVAEYDPYNNTMKSCGTVKKACQAVNNWLPEESQEKVHCQLMSMPDGKIWFSTHDNDGILNHYYRGSHLMYIDVYHGDTIVDYSKSQKYYYKRNAALPTLMDHSVPASDTSGVAVQWHSLMIVAFNPYCPRYLWTGSIGPNGRIQVWDLIADTTRSITATDDNQRELAVSRTGNLYFNDPTTAYKRTVNGVNRVIGRNLAGEPACMIYTHSRDTAYTTMRGTGELVMFDMTRDTAFQVADFPDGSSNNYRAMAISRDGRKIYLIGNASNLYEYTIATRQYRVLQSLSGELAGQDLVHSRNIIDTLGNWYLSLHDGSVNGASLLKISMGKDLVAPLHIPDTNELSVEAPSVGESGKGTLLDASPNPFSRAVRLRWGSEKPFIGGNLVILDIGGREVARHVLSGGAPARGVEWNAGTLPPGIYLAKLNAGRREFFRKLILTE